MSASFGTISHTADLKFWVEADSLAELFSFAATALARLMYQGPRDAEVRWLQFSTQGSDFADLMVHFLSEVVYQLDAEGLLVASVRIISLSPDHLEAELGVIDLDSCIHQMGEPVKAVTYHEASVNQTDSGWRAEVVLDV
jgi:SHS2 domain-containing protein